MKAWLVTWEMMSDSAAVADRVAAILPPRWTEKRVADVVEFLYARATSTLRELAAYAKHPASNPYRASIGMSIDDVPHGDRITCGQHPWLYARKVTDLEVSLDAETDFERIEWREPDTWRWKEDRSGFEHATEGGRDGHRRQVVGRLLDDEIWDRGSGTWRPGFERSDA